MEVEILEDKKNKIVFKVKEEDHTILNLLREELWKDGDVKVAAYKIEHPLVGIPEMTVEVKQGNEAKKALKDAISRLNKTLDSFKKSFESKLK